MFELNKQICTIAHLNIRTEKHGDEDKTAADLKLQASVPNAFLNNLHPDLKAALYMRDEDQGDFDEHHMPRLRFAELPKLNWKLALEGCTLTLHHDIERKNIELEADVDKIVLQPIDGGSVTLTFRAQVYPTEEHVSRMAFLLNSTVKVSVQDGDPADSDESGVELPLGDGQPE